MRNKAWLARISEKQKDREADMLSFWSPSPVYCGCPRQDTNLPATSLLLGMAKKVPALLQTSLWESKAQAAVFEVRTGRDREFALRGLSTKLSRSELSRSKHGESFSF